MNAIFSVRSRWNEIGEVETVPLGDETQIQETLSRIHLQDETELEKKFKESATDTLDVGFFVRRLTDIIPNPWRAAHIVKGYSLLIEKMGQMTGRCMNNVCISLSI